ncbi:MAG: glycosyltransferase family 39 protein [Actinomycetota bacterium]|nr:glycosyltransferase family 39 protein [Actinomycetota bacterium]
MTGDDRAFGLRLAAIVALGAAWRLLYLFVVKFDDNLRLNDSLYYSMQAGRNSEGDWFREALSDLPGAEHGPLTSLYLTPWSIPGGDNVPWQRFAMTLLGIATIVVIGFVGRRLGGPRVGLLAAAIAAAYPNLWINDSLVMSESLACLIVAAALLVALRFHDRPTPVDAVALGLLCGLGALTRSEIALFAVGFAVLAWWRVGAVNPSGSSGVRRLLLPAVIVLTALAAMAPWMLYNLGQFEHPVLLSTNDGTTLLGANCDSTYYDDIGGWDIGCLGPLSEEGSVDGSERSRQRRETALEYVGDHLERVPVVVMARVGRVLDVYGLTSLVALDTGEEKAEWAVWAGIVCWWILAIAAIVGWRALGTGDESARARWWLLVPPAAVVLTAALFYGAHRIRAPAEPVVVVLAAVGILTLIDRRRVQPVPMEPPEADDDPTPQSVGPVPLWPSR